jgi:hypothetical protein
MPELPDAPERTLTVPLLCRGSFRDGPFLASCLGAVVVLLVGSLLLITRSAVGGMVWAAIAAAVVFTAGYALALARRREWLEMTATGFVLSRRGRRRAYADEQVEAIAHDVRVALGDDQRCRIVLEVGRERVECRYPVKLGDTDPFAGFVSRLAGAVAARVERGLDGGAVLRGDGWSLGAEGLRVRGEVYPLEAVTFAGSYDQHLCLWRADEERPFLRLPRGSRNVLPLGAVLRRRLRGRTDAGPTQPRGRMLLERRSTLYLGSRLGACVCAGISLLFLAGSGAFAVPEVKPPPWPAYVLCVLGIVGLTAVLAWQAWRERKSRLRFHEHGVMQTGSGGDVWLPYDEIAEVVWDRHSLALRPSPGLRRTPVVLRFVTWHHVAYLASVRDLVCRPLARRWAEALHDGPVRWTHRLRFLPDSLEVLALMAPGGPTCPRLITVPYEQLSYRLERGRLSLFVRGQEQPVCREPSTLSNFFVGLTLLDWLCRGERPAEPGGSAPRPAADDRVTPGPAEGVRERDASYDAGP